MGREHDDTTEVLPESPQGGKRLQGCSQGPRCGGGSVGLSQVTVSSVKQEAGASTTKERGARKCWKFGKRREDRDCSFGRVESELHRSERNDGAPIEGGNLWSANSSSQPEACLSIHLTGSSAKRQFWILMKPNLSIFSLTDPPQAKSLRAFYLDPQDFLLLVFPKSFIVCTFYNQICDPLELTFA